jgi:hypothetical protein
MCLELKVQVNKIIAGRGVDMCRSLETDSPKTELEIKRV